MLTVSVSGQKGGVGKTTTTVNLAASLGERGQRVLVVDLDPQACASTWLGVLNGAPGLPEVLTRGALLEPLVRETTAHGVDLVPASVGLIGAELHLPGRETALRQAIERLPASRWDWLLVDCPPSLGPLTVSAFAACDRVLVPVETSTMALAAVEQLAANVAGAQQAYNPALRLWAILPCRVDYRTNLSREVVELLHQRYGDIVMATVIHETVRLREAWSFQKPVTTYATGSRGSEDYRAAAAELLRRAKKEVSTQ